MGFGAAKPGSTLPSQGGKGGVQPQTPTGLPSGYNGPIPGVYNPGDYISPGMNQPAQVPPQGGKFPGSSLPPQGGKSQADQDRFNAQIIASQNQPPYRPIGNPIQPTMQQPQVPPQGGKFPGYSLPPQGGKSQADQDRFNAQIIASQNQPAQGVDQARALNAGKGNAPVQPTVPPQGGKFPGTPMQQTALENAINTRPMPQVMPRPAMTRPVMPRPAMPRPTMTRPSLIGSGLAGLRGRR
jgi:hypothetical protein